MRLWQQKQGVEQGTGEVDAGVEMADKEPAAWQLEVTDKVKSSRRVGRAQDPGANRAQCGHRPAYAPRIPRITYLYHGAVQ